jgi:autotransporter-associated beta strand protein
MSASAANFLWTGGTGAKADQWNNKNNWTWGPKAIPGAADMAYFTNSASSYTPTLTAASSILGLNYSANAASYTIGGTYTLTIGTSGITDNSANGQTINAPVALAGAQTWSVASGGSLTVGGTVNNAGYTLTLNGAGAKTLSGVVSGTGGLTASGSGTATLSAANTYSGAVTVGSGATLNVGHANALGSGTAGLALNGTMNLNANPSSSRPVTMNAGSVINANNQSGSFGGLAVAGNSTINLVNDSTSATLNFGAATRTAGTLTINNWANTLTRDSIFLTSASASFLANTVFAGSGQTSSALWGGSAPYELVPFGVVPVPEPQTYAAVFGLGALGFVIYRRRFSARA